MIEIYVSYFLFGVLLVVAYFRWNRKEPQTLWLESFTLQPAQNRISPCRIRLYRETDFEACVEILRLIVAAKQVPAEYEEIYAQYLKERRALILVCEADGGLCGLGGISINQKNLNPVALCSYGLIHPAHQRKGYGTALLLARLGSLPSVPVHWVIHLSSQKAGPTFYHRFGFRRIHSTTD